MNPLYLDSESISQVANFATTRSAVIILTKRYCVTFSKKSLREVGVIRLESAGARARLLEQCEQAKMCSLNRTQRNLRPRIFLDAQDNDIEIVLTAI